MNKIVSLISIIILAGMRVVNAQPAADSLHTAKSSWGVIVGEKKAKSYTTRDGSMTYTIGGSIHVGMGSAEDKSFQYIKRHVSNNRFVKVLLTNPAPLAKDYEDTRFVIADIYEGYTHTDDVLIKNAPKTVFIVLVDGSSTPYDVAIEKALKTKEVEAH